MVPRAAAEDLDRTRPRLGKWAGTFPLRDGLATAGRDTHPGEVTHVPVRRDPRYLFERSCHAVTPRRRRLPACRCRSGQFLQAHGRGHRLPSFAAAPVEPWQFTPAARGSERPAESWPHTRFLRAGKTHSLAAAAGHAGSGREAPTGRAGHGRKGNKAAGPDRAMDGAFGGCRSGAGVMPTSLRTGLRALASSPLQLSAPVAGGCPTAPVDASAAAIRVAASTSFYASCEPQAAGCMLDGSCDSP